MKKFLSKKDARILAIQKTRQPIQFISMEYNWPCDSNENDLAFFRIFAATKGQLHEGVLFLQGKNCDGEWTINLPFESGKVFRNFETAETFSFRTLELKDLSQFPVEFVLRYEKIGGDILYENNNEQNFKLHPRSGRGTTAIPVGKTIFDFGEVVAFESYRRKEIKVRRSAEVDESTESLTENVQENEGNE